MTKGLDDFLNIPHLEDVLKKEGVITKDIEDQVVADEAANEQTIANLELAEKNLALVNGQDHADAMDALYDETLKHAKDIMDLGFNIDHARAARMFEVAGSMYKVALDAKNSKRDAQLKAMELILKQQRLELEKQIAKGNINTDTVEGAVLIEDRNELIKRLREQAKNERKP